MGQHRGRQHSDVNQIVPALKVFKDGLFHVQDVQSHVRVPLLGEKRRGDVETV